MTETPVGRRIVLGMVGLGAVGVIAGSRITAGISRLLSPVEQRDPTGLSSLVPAGGGWRYYSVAGGEPLRTAADYRLTVDGLVDQPRTYTYQELLALEQTRVVRDFQCVTGWRVPSVPWSGVRLGTLLEAAGVRPGAQALAFASFDSVDSESLTLSQARRPDVLVALRMYGKPVTRAHGGPVRLFVAPMYGYKSLKWLSRITVTDSVQPGFWEHNGYDVNAWVGHSNGRTDDPT